MTYLVDGKQYKLDYQELKSEWMRFCEMENEVFIQNAIHAAHLACIICYLKGLGNEATISDRGIIHELIHLATIDVGDLELLDIRKQFTDLLRLN